MTRALAITAGILTGGIATFFLLLAGREMVIEDQARRMVREVEDYLDDHRRARP